jgi:predicted TPR repeat methyltransferase/Flp pilus assembly protein TadD
MLSLHDALRLAVTAYNSNKFSEAEQLCRVITTANPDLFEGHHLLALIQTRLGRRSEALASYEHALTIRPDYVQALNNRAVLFRVLNRLDEALVSCDKALAIKPDQVVALFNRAGILSLLKRYEEALSAFNGVIALKPDYAYALYNRGVLLQTLNRFEDALASYEQALEVWPNHAEVLGKHAAVLCTLKRFEKALVTFDKLLTVKPTNAGALNNRGVALQRLMRFEDALASYDKALALRPDFAEALCNRGDVLGSLKRLEEAVGSFAKALAVSPDNARAHNNLGRVLQQVSKLNEAEPHFRRALALNPDYADARTSLGLLMIEQGRLDEAIAAARTADRLSDNLLSAGSHYSLGTLMARCGISDLARKHLQMYLEQDLEDCRGARMLLAKLGFEQIPQRAPAGHIRSMYARRATFWDRGPTVNAPYRGDTLVARALERLVGGPAKLDILDAGCGTGLVGQRIRHLAARLDGVDLSDAMLAKAKEKNTYDNLHHFDLVSFLAARVRSYDVVTCAATLIHFGDLSPVFQAAAQALRDGGLFVFTLYPHEHSDFVVHPFFGLAAGGCYAHGRNYVARTAKAANFDIELLEDETHEYDGPEAVTALVVGLRRQCRESDHAPRRFARH